MDDLIKRQDAIDAMYKIVEGSKNLMPYFDDDLAENPHIDVIVDALENLPSAEPVIIRCKDCKWCREHYDTDGNSPYWICRNWDSGTDADGFCYYAERRTDEADYRKE